ncbi:hypothetical protein SDC9_205137 [bioreactor metagenome]|uniref:Uncharacterized protein n=1 Tax=bioreactor metagenome TaxID=1076179 RepID=A0A645JD10_9ZZZZ
MGVVRADAAEMNGVVGQTRQASLGLQDVNLAAGGPEAIDFIPGHQPESGPEALAPGQADARLKPAVALGE